MSFRGLLTFFSIEGFVWQRIGWGFYYGGGEFFKELRSAGRDRRLCGSVLCCLNDFWRLREGWRRHVFLNHGGVCSLRVGRRTGLFSLVPFPCHYFFQKSVQTGPGPVCSFFVCFFPSALFLKCCFFAKKGSFF